MVLKLLRRLARPPASVSANEEAPALARPRSPGSGRRERLVRAEKPPPSAWVKLSVWRRDRGECVRCGAQEGVWFDYAVPVREGGRITEQNIRLMCRCCKRREEGASTRGKGRGA